MSDEPTKADTRSAADLAQAIADLAQRSRGANQADAREAEDLRFRSNPPPVLTTKDVGRLLQMPPSSVTRLVRLGRLRYIEGLRAGYLFLLQTLLEDLRAHEIVHPVTPAPIRRRGRGDKY